MLEKLFKLKENGTNIKTEFIAGLTTFVTMAYIIFINPNVLSQTGMDPNSVFTATILASVIGTLIMALYANVPYALAPGLGLGALFTYTVCMTLGFTWQQALAMVFICGVINILITVTKLRRILINAIPEFLQHSISVGIGLFIAYIGVMNANFIQFSINNIDNGIAMASNVVPSISNFNTPNILLALIGLIITSILLAKKVPGSILIGIILTTIIGIPLGVTQLSSEFSSGITLEHTFLKLDFQGLFTAKSGIIVVLMTIFTFSLSDIFDTIGTFIGTGRRAGIFKDTKNNIKLEKALYADSFGTCIGALLGTSNTTTYVESAAGIEAGGRTGLTAVFTSIFFLMSFILAPVMSIIPTAATAPILILIGVLMIDSVVKINWEDISLAIPAFFTITFMPFAYSITTGIEMGFLFYVITKLFTGKAKEVHPIIYIFTLLFLIDFIYKAIILI